MFRYIGGHRSSRILIAFKVSPLSLRYYQHFCISTMSSHYCTHPSQQPIRSRAWIINISSSICNQFCVIIYWDSYKIWGPGYIFGSGINSK